ncbi:MAG TPA: wax ester/triacylglycerol synthase domain-containing protein, partial [Streptosporangiaceae bacterium]|nr:wax ester/triacylglycerol synthase domain-containing protein [Streptosporangiaceae bacterium]
ARLTEVLEERLPLVPVLRRKLKNVPFGLDQPYWVDDADFDIEYHVREIALPRPGSDAQLTEQVARLHARPLDRSRPLWEIYLITGLARRRAAVYTKIHHSAIDGASGAELLTVLLDLSPGGRELPARQPFRPARPPDPVTLTVLAAARLAWRPVQTVYLTNQLIRVLPTLSPAVSTLVGGMLGLNRGDGGVIATTPVRSPATPFNRPITQHRRVAFRSVELDRVKAVKNAFGVSVNDVVMAMCAGALRRWLADHQALPATPLIAMIPVSVRDPAVLGDRPVERRGRGPAGHGRDDLAVAVVQAEHAAQERADRRGQRGQDADQLVGDAHGLHRPPREPRGGDRGQRHRPGRPGGAERRAGRKLAPARAEVEQHGQQLGAGRAVDRRVVDLRVDGGAAAGQPGDQVDLPQRAAAVQRAGVQPRDLLGELGVRPGAGQRELADVVLDVEVRVVDPVRLVQAERHAPQLAAQHRDQRQPLPQHLGQPGQGQRLGRLPRVQDAHPAHVAGGVRRLQGEERRVQAGELLHRGAPLGVAGQRRG